MFSYQKDLLYDTNAQFVHNRLRVLVIGSSKVGKTALIRRMVDNVFMENREQPDKFDLNRLTVMARAVEGQLVRIELQEADSSVLAAPARQSGEHDQPVVHDTVAWLDTHSILFVYDITSEDSYEELTKQLTILQKRASPDCNICLVGTKADLKSARQVIFSKAEQDAELRDMSLLEVSARDGTNIGLLVDEIVDYITERREAQEESRKKHETGYLSDQEEVYQDPIQPVVAEPVYPKLFCLFGWPFGRSSK